MKFASSLSAIALFGLLASTPAFAQIESREGIALQNQISELRRDIGELRDNTGGSSGGSLLGGSRRQSSSSEQANSNSELMTSVIERLARLEDQVRVLNGRMDEMANANQREHDEVAKQFADLQFRLDNGGVAGAAAKPGTTAPAPGAASTLSPPPANLGTVPVKPSLPALPVPIAQAPTAGPRSPDQMIQEGNAALARRDYAAAEQAAREVPKTSPRNYDAQFLLAQSLAGEKRNVDAALAYGNLYQANKQGSHAQDALLGLANSQSALGDKHAACVALNSLNANFPSPRADIAAKAAAVRTSNGCN